MTGSQGSQSFRSRSRQWSALACVVLAGVALLAFAQQHPVFGLLALCGAATLFKGSALNPRHARRPARVAQTVLPASGRRRPLRKAA
ncbi:hypothetical protein EYS42_15770 [Aquabacterium lacunae]|jgi:drug/metabolite transporter (DMT)-like permease|uniref:Uncharacterized protein n=1 Tax=Aquabacterium lacunae TaxID=2528630 RepID=A0A4Q9GUU3_9BURK|nr:hypothetical protein [Aquabacterium lacunae]TBO27893.1 hypothetical protein EYS42_15770 [Aquabacterium lacunae]